jgi:hypothetical protein
MRFMQEEYDHSDSLLGLIPRCHDGHIDMPRSGSEVESYKQQAHPGKGV